MQIIKIASELAKFRLNNGRNWKSKLRKSFRDNTCLNPHLKDFNSRFAPCVLGDIKKDMKLNSIVSILREVNNG